MQGYTACRKELESTLRKVSQLGYSVVLIAHSTSRIEKMADGSEVEIIGPDLPKRAAAICNAMVDLIGYIGVEYVDGVSKRWLYTRETPTLFAGSRFKYMSPKIPFGYDELVKAISDAIDKAEQLDGAKVTNEAGSFSMPEAQKLDFNALMTEARDIWTSQLSKAQTDEEKADIVRVMSKKVEMVFGRKIKLSEVTEDQVDLLALALIDLRELANA